MNPNETNPLMFILEADPGRYIKTPAATVLALLKALEGAAACLCGVRAIGFLRALYAAWDVLPVMKLLQNRLPAELSGLLPSGTLSSRGMALTVLAGAAAICALVGIVCLLLEGAAALYLRFALGGAKLLNVTRRAAFPVSIVLALSVTGFCALSLWEAFTHGVRLNALLQPALVMAGCVLALWLRVSYNRGAASVISAVEYELRLGFKESVPKSLKLGRDAFLLCLVYLAAAAALCCFVNWRSYAVAAFAALAVKYSAAMESWRVFRRCHR